MSTTNPCCHDCDWTDGDEPDVTDIGCCSPAPVRKSCDAPELPVPDCDEDDATVAFDPETETFIVTTTMYTASCLPWLDKDNSPWLALIA